VTVNAARDCTWSAQSQASWLKVATTSGQGAATISVTAAENEAAAARTGGITVNDQRLDFTQEGRGCTIMLSGPTEPIAATGGNGALNIGTLAGCPWTVTTSAPWVVPSVTSGSSATTVPFEVQPNTDTAREAVITVGAASVTISQDAAAVVATPCTFTLDEATRDFPAAGGNGSVSVNTQSGCSWNVTGGASWITVNGTSGTGSSAVTFTVAVNTAPVARQATLTIAGRVYTVTEQAAACMISITPMAQSFSAAGGNDTVQVTAPAGCTWTASSSTSWAQLGATTGTGSAQLPYQVQASTDTAARTAVLTIGGRTLTITQNGVTPACSYDLTPATSNFVATGGSSTVHVATGTGCAWTAVSNMPWITIPSQGASGSGTADVAYTVAANTTTSTRSGTITIGGKVHTVTQDAAAPVCTYALSPPERTFQPAGGSGTVTVTTGPTCTWTAVSNAGFVTVLTPSGTGSGTINYFVASGGNNVDRTATITVGGQVHTVRQVRTQ
jgi:hypothetical protein